MLEQFMQANITRRSERMTRRRAAVQRVVGALLEAGMTQEAVAEAIGTSQGIVSKWANGLATPSVPALTCLFRLAHERNLELEMSGWREL